jgi:hypothetical protein
MDPGVFKPLTHCLFQFPHHSRSGQSPNGGSSIQSSSSSDRRRPGRVRLPPRAPSFVGTPFLTSSGSSSSSKSSRWKLHFSTWSLNVLCSSSIPFVYLLILMKSSSPLKWVYFPWLKLEISWPNLHQLVMTWSLSILACNVWVKFVEVWFSFPCLRSSPKQSPVQLDNVWLSRTKSVGHIQCPAGHHCLFVPFVFLVASF